MAESGSTPLSPERDSTSGRLGLNASCSRPGDAGFALVEALASLVIVGMISLMIIEGVGTGRRVWERIDTREAAGEAVDGAQTALRDRIEQIYPATLFDETPPYPDFAGHSDGLVFLSNPPQSGRPAPLRRYRLYLDTAGRLILSSVNDVAPPKTAAVASQVLLTGVRQLSVDYFGSIDGQQAARWWDLWRPPAPLPLLIRIRVTFEPGDTRLWPDLMVHPRTTVDTACLLSSITHGCKGRA